MKTYTDRAYRNSDGFIELFRTRGFNEDGTRTGIERLVTIARELNELDQYFTKAKSAKYNPHHPNQLKIE